ncbi:U3 snoRNP protein IMP4 (nucleomorph) [Lotharella oceanica]|uniref:U3 snoRNP protein IMP4 n=1 Tax=Lotharella oceanica TaxID=641309 RepID=A0A060DH43_9EUKA|nr:U3 snoRNP protein IMP4 [Lotharella oceanica]
MSKFYNDFSVSNKIVITTSRHSTNKTKNFVKILSSLIPHSTKITRGNLKLSQLFYVCHTKLFNILIIVHEYKNKPNGLYLVYFTKNITIYLKLFHLNEKTILKKYDKHIRYCNNRKVIFHNNYSNNNIYRIILRLFKIIFSNYNKNSNNIIFLFFYKSYINIRCYLKYHFDKVIEIGPRLNMKLLKISFNLFKK